MFNLGGVAALKQHLFFEDLNWSDLINLRIEPPIDLSKPYTVSNPSVSNGNSPNNTKKGVDVSSPMTTATPLKVVESSGNNSNSPNILTLTTEHLTRHFHEGFTGQQISFSVVEEGMSTSTRSRAGERKNMDNTHGLTHSLTD